MCNARVGNTAEILSTKEIPSDSRLKRKHSNVPIMTATNGPGERGDHHLGSRNSRRIPKPKTNVRTWICVWEPGSNFFANSATAGADGALTVFASMPGRRPPIGPMKTLPTFFPKSKQSAPVLIPDSGSGSPSKTRPARLTPCRARAS